MRNPSGGEDKGIADRVDVDDGGGVSLLVGIARGVRLGSVVTVAVGTGAVIPQAAKLTVMVKIKIKLDNQCDVFIAHPKSCR